jgi:hypothetical protein
VDLEFEQTSRQVHGARYVAAPEFGGFTNIDQQGFRTHTVTGFGDGTFLDGCLYATDQFGG